MAPIFTRLSNAFGFGAPSGGAAQTPGSATGGSMLTNGGYQYHVFTSNGNFVVSGDLPIPGVEFIVVAGGGGGGIDVGGGGGAGGCAHGNPFDTTVSYTHLRAHETLR